MKRLLFAAALSAALITIAPGQQTPPPATADPYANNAAAGTLRFPLAAPAGKDSNAKAVPPANAGQQGRFRHEDLAIRPAE